MVSIIIPVFNTEKYLDQCIKSIVMQTYKNIEILLINDGSTDGSGQICKAWSQKDARIRYIEKRNEGQGKTRNLGIHMAQGEYLIFVDSDDFIDENLLQESVRYIKEKQADICIYTYKQTGGQELKVPLEFVLKGTCSVTENEEALSQMPPMLCTKIFRTRLLKSSNIVMKNVMCEDLIYQAQIFIRAKSICTLNKAFYHYRYLREGNISTDGNRYFELTQSVDMLNEAFMEKEDKPGASAKHAAYWLPLYSLSFYIFKIFLFRVHRREDFNLQELKKVYAQLLGQYSACLEKWFHPYLDISLLNKNYLLIGSYGLRAMIHAFLLEERHLRQDYSASGIVSIMSGKAEWGEGFRELPYENAYRKRHIVQDIVKEFQEHSKRQGKIGQEASGLLEGGFQKGKGIFQTVGEGRIDFLVIDLLEEISDLVKVKEDCYITDSPYLKEMMEEISTKGTGQEAYAKGDAKGMPVKETYRKCERISFLNPRRRELFLEYVKDFIACVRTWKAPVILVKNFLCEKHSLYYDAYTEYPDIDRIQQINQELEWCYATFAECMPEAVVVDSSSFRNLEFTYDRFAFGCEPIYHNAGYYRRMGIEMNRRICEAMGYRGSVRPDERME